MYDGESEVSSAQDSSDDATGSPTTGPMPQRSWSFPQKTRKTRRNLQEIMNTNPGSAFPWDEILFYVPEWLPSVIRQHILQRIEVGYHKSDAADGRPAEAR